MSDTYLIPQFIIDYLQKSRSTKNPQILTGGKLSKFKTPEIEKWFKDNEVTAGYLWKSFVSQGKTEFYYKTCPVCGKRFSLKSIVKRPNANYCSNKCSQLSKEVQEQRKRTWLEKYGVEHPFQSKEVQDKIKQIHW